MRAVPKRWPCARLVSSCCLAAVALSAGPARANVWTVVQTIDAGQPGGSVWDTLLQSLLRSQVSVTLTDGRRLTGKLVALEGEVALIEDANGDLTAIRKDQIAVLKELKAAEAGVAPTQPPPVAPPPGGQPAQPGYPGQPQPTPTGQPGAGQAPPTGAMQPGPYQPPGSPGQAPQQGPPPPATGTGYGPAPTGAPPPQGGASYPADPSQPADAPPTDADKPARGSAMMWAGIGTTALGVAGLAVMGVGMAFAVGANDFSWIDPDDLSTREDQIGRGYTGNAMAVSGGIAAGVLIPTGAVLWILGARSRKSAVAVVPSLHRQGGGLSLRARF